MHSSGIFENGEFEFNSWIIGYGESLNYSLVLYQLNINRKSHILLMSCLLCIKKAIQICLLNNSSSQGIHKKSHKQFLRNLIMYLLYVNYFQYSRISAKN